MTWQPLPLPDGRYSDDVRPFAQQDVCNYLPTPAESAGTRSPMLLKPVPGLQVFAEVGEGPHRGARDVEGKLFVVSGRTLYQVATDGTATAKGTIPGTGRVSMAHNQIAGGNELVIGTVDNSYVWNTVTEALTATGVGLQSVDFLGQLILGVGPARRFWRYSALADGTSWSSLDVESAESSPDRIVGGIVSQGEWLVFGERTIEVFSNTPNESTAFQRGAVIERGCANAATLCRLDNSVFFVDATGIPCRLQGYTPVPIAPKAIIQEIAQCDPRKLFAQTWEDRGYVVYYITAQDGRTWGYDVTSQRWHRRESFGLDRWRLDTLFKWRGDWYGGDFQSGLIYKLAWGYVYEGRDILPRKLRAGVLHNNGNRAFIHGLKITAQTGGVESVPGATPHAALTLAGDLPDATIGEPASLQYGSTGGRLPKTFSVIAGALPDGVEMDTSGRVSGAYNAAGDYSWTVQVTDADSLTAQLPDTASVTGTWWNPADRINQVSYYAELTDSTRLLTPVNTDAPNNHTLQARGYVTRSVANGGSGNLRYFEVELARPAPTSSTAIQVGVLGTAVALDESLSYNAPSSSLSVGAASGNDLHYGSTASIASNAVSGSAIIGVLVDIASGMTWYTIDGAYAVYSGLAVSPANFPTTPPFGAVLPPGTYAPFGGVNAVPQASPIGTLRLRQHSYELEFMPDGALAWASP